MSSPPAVVISGVLLLAASMSHCDAVDENEPNAPTNSKNLTVDFQADFNTVDVRGQRSQQALSEVEAALGSVPTGCALFVVHGVATGRLRTEIHQFLSRYSLVDRYVLAKDSGGGCTAVYLK